MSNSKTIERELFIKDAQRLYKLIGQTDFLNLILPNEIDQIVVQRKFNNNETFEKIGQSIGLSNVQTFRIYQNSIRKIKQQVRKFINYYIVVKTSNIGDQHKNIIENNTKKDTATKLNKTNNQDLIISNLVHNNIKWVNALKNRGINTIGDLLKYSRKDIMLISGIGPNAILEIEYLLGHYNLKLKVTYNSN